MKKQILSFILFSLAFSLAGFAGEADLVVPQLNGTFAETAAKPGL